jgi:sterol desaturase/sphingolipid hydroxylase (fatty acid hydroxylase superfamily)
MDSFMAFFSDLPPLYKFAWIMAWLSAGLLIEFARPLFRHPKLKRGWPHFRTNLALMASTMAINTVVGVLTVGVFEWVETAEIGLLPNVAWNAWLELGIAFLALDLIGQYTVHYVLHKQPLLWRLHMVHHSDTHVDATTGMRHHPLDFLLRETFALVAVIVVGAPLAFYAAYRITTVFFTYFSHANFRLPDAVDRALSWVIISPNMHKFHHHDRVVWTDSNYGNILSIWDRIFGTLVYDDPSKVTYGLDTTDPERADDLSYQLSLPWRK